MTFNICGGISTQRPNIFIFRASCDIFVYGSFGPVVNMKAEILKPTEFQNFMV